MEENQKIIVKAGDNTTIPDHDRHVEFASQGKGMLLEGKYNSREESIFITEEISYYIWDDVVWWRYIADPKKIDEIDYKVQEGIFESLKVVTQDQHDKMGQTIRNWGKAQS